MITIWYEDECGNKITYKLNDLEAVMTVASSLINSPIDLEYIHYDGGVFNLNTFELC